MKEPGLDGRHRDRDGKIHVKRGDARNGNLSTPIVGFPPNTRVDTMRERTGGFSLKEIQEIMARLRKLNQK